MRYRIIKALLFDIDGTLLKCNGAGRSSLTRATKETFGTVGNMDKVDFQGKTDPIILKESLSSIGFDNLDIQNKTEQLKTRYFRYLKNDLRTHDPILLPGVNDILNKLDIIENKNKLKSLTVWRNQKQVIIK